MASKAPAARPSEPARKDRAAPEPGPAARNSTPGSRNQVAESGQSQESLPINTDINSYSGTKQTRNGNEPDFRKTSVTSLYRHCHDTAQGSMNHLTNVALRRRAAEAAIAKTAKAAITAIGA
jgi:hypothetical protein